MKPQLAIFRLSVAFSCGVNTRVSLVYAFCHSAFAVDNWMEEAPANLARRTDITLTDPAENMSSISGQVRYTYGT